MLSPEKQKAIIEAVLFASAKPVTLTQLIKKLRKATAEQIKSSSVNDETADVATSETTPEESQSAENPDSVAIVSNESTEDLLPEEANDNDDPMSQLLSKQKELNDDFGKGDVLKIIQEIQDELKGAHHGIELVNVAKGYILRTKYEMLEYLKEEQVETPMRLSPSSLETLSIVAYQQPLTRQKIEEIRGVDSGGVLKTLLEKGFIKLIGRQEDAGKALIYGTTSQFLQIFGLNSLKDLPSLKDLHGLQLTDGDASKKDFSSQAQELISPEEQDLFAASYSELHQFEDEVLNDLDESLKNLRDVEKQVIAATTPAQPPQVTEENTQQGEES